MTIEILLEAVKMAALGAVLILITAIWLAWPFCLWERLSEGVVEKLVLLFAFSNGAFAIFFLMGIVYGITQQ